VSPFRLFLGLLVVCAAFAQDSPLKYVLEQVENRYNHTKTLQVSFREDYTPPGKPTRTEAGQLLLRKPGRMRWDYTSPKGKLFVSDGKNLYLYTPADNRAERMKLKESDDMRAPLAFLLGKLNFEKEFRNIRAQNEPRGTRITAEPKTENLPYSQVEFLVDPDRRIREVKVTGFDRSVLDFNFDNEQVDPPLNAGLFEFKTPPGVVIVESAQ
jgi:outer membrane lipoprotein carrier protein